MRPHARYSAAVAAVLTIAAVAAFVGLSERGAGPGRQADGTVPSTDGAAAPAEREPIRYDAEWPGVPYADATLSDPVAALAARIRNGEAALRASDSRGYLESLLGGLGIDASSQVLVFSKTSLQIDRITATSPRAIYFNDDTYVAWVPGGSNIEIATLDPEVGQVFYTLDQPPAAGTGFERHLTRCLRCHDSYSLTGGGVPRFILGSGYTGPQGNLVSHEGWILTNPGTALRFRWGGWYVTGRHGEQVHLGNMVVRDAARLAEDIDGLRVGNIDTLEGLIDTQPYLRDTSDIVALMVLQHQIGVQNVMTRVNYESRAALYPESLDPDRSGIDDVPAPVRESLEAASEPLVEALLLVGEVELTDRIEGRAAFVEQFQSRALTDSRGRSLRALNLETRLFEHPLSFLIHSRAFFGLPLAVREHVSARIADVLGGRDTSERFAHLSPADREAALEIVAETAPGLVR